MLHITEHIKDDRIFLILKGRLDFQACKTFRTAIEQAKRSTPRHIILNFADVPFVNSAGLGLVMLAFKDLEEAQIRLSLEVTEGYVQEVFSVTNIGQKIPIAVIETKPPLPASPTGAPPPKTSPTPPPVFESADMHELLLPILEALDKDDIDLPPLSEVAKKILVFVNDPKATSGQLKQLIERDPILTARIFKIANSAAYGTHREIKLLSDAISMIGLTSVAMLAFALSVQSGVFIDRGYEREVRTLWGHALATAFYGRTLAAMIGHNQDTAFLCGLLHSLGKLFVVHTVNVCQPLSGSPLPWSTMLTLMEQSYIEVGRKLAEAWNFPFPVKEAINLHQHFSYHLATDDSEGAAITCLAKHLATYHLDSVAFSGETIRALPVATALNVPHDVMDGILEIKPEIQKQIDSVLI